MARQVLTVAGYAAGFFLPGGPAVWGAIGAAVGSYVDPQKIKGPRLGEASEQTAAEGVFRPVVFGTGPVTGNIIHRGNHQIVKHTERQGKGGGPEVETEREYWTFAIRICEGEIAGVLRIKMDGKLVYDVTPESVIPEESAAFAEQFTLYLGTEDQEPDPDLEAYMGAGNVNAYRGTAYAVFPNFDTTSGRRIPTFMFEVASAAAEVVDHPIMASGETALNTFRTTHSEDGAEWGDAENPEFQVQFLLPGQDDRFIAYNNEFAWYTDDFGVTWLPVTESFTNIGVNHGAVAGTALLIPASVDGIYRSTNNGASFSRVNPAGIRPTVLAGSPSGVAVGASVFDDHTYVSADSGASWVPGGDHGLSFTLGAACADFLGDRFAIGANESGISGDAAISYPGLSAGADPTIVVFTGETGESVSAMGWATIGGEIVRVAGLTNGHLYRQVGSGPWERCADDLGVRVNDITSRGSRLFAGGGLSGAGVIMYSDDGDNWIEVDQPLVYSVQSIVARPSELQNMAGEPVALSSIVSSLHGRAMQPAASFDASALTDMVDGVVFAGDYTCGDAIRTLAGTYFFGAPEYDDGTGYKIRYTKRGGDAALTLTEDDLVDVPDEQTRMDAAERPRVLHLHYQSPTIGYAPAKASPQRFSVSPSVGGEASVQTPVCFSDQDEAWQRADVMLKVAHVEIGGETKLTVPWKFLDLVATDNIGLSLRGQLRRQRIDQAIIRDGVIELTLTADRQSAWTSNITGLPLPLPTPPPPSIVGATVGAWLDIPALNDNNDRLLGYAAMTGQTEAWYGALAQRSLDAGSTWADAANTPPMAVMGVLQGDITTASPHTTDTTNTVRVRLYRPGDELESLTDQQFLSEGGAFALSWDDGGTRRWEVMQYRDAVNDGDGVFALTTLLRGRLNTETAAHTAGAIFVLLDRVIAVDAITAWLGQDLTHRFISYGTSADAATTVTETYTGASQTEWPVAHVRPERLDSNTIKASPVPRHRFGTEVNPVRSSNWDGYRYVVTDGSNTINRDSSATSETFDVTGWASPVTVTVAQLNRITGEGPTVSEDIA